MRGQNYLAIQAAMPVFLQHLHTVVGYKIEVMKEGNLVYVTFVDQEGAPGDSRKPGEETWLCG